MGTPFGITIDMNSPKTGRVTLRERDSTSQLIGTIDEVVDVVIALTSGAADWSHASQKLRVFEGQAAEAEN